MQPFKKKKQVKIKAKRIKNRKYAFNEQLEGVSFAITCFSVGEAAFYGCKSLKSISLPDSLEEIEEDAFSLCTELKDLALPSSLKKIGERAFCWSGIEDIVIPKSINNIPDEAFSNCRFLKAVTLPEGIEKIGKEAFSECMELSQINLPQSIKEIGSKSFKNCRSLEEIVLPPTIKKLEAKTFENCVNLKKVILPDCLEEIEEGCFEGCVKLSEINLPEKLRTISKKAFCRCEALKSVTLPRKLEKLGEKAFFACPELKLIYLNSNLISAGKTIFSEVSLTPPESIKNLYCTSFLSKEDYAHCPTITIPETTRELLLGYDGILPYSYITKNKTCFRHIIELKKYSAKLFIGENYYSADKKIIDNGDFDFQSYDSFFNNAENQDKPFIAAFRLAYPVMLAEKSKETYEAELSSAKEAAAAFAVEYNEDVLLKYLLKSFDFSYDFLTTLYFLAEKTGAAGLQQIIPRESKKNRLSELDKMFEELSL